MSTMAVPAAPAEAGGYGLALVCLALAGGYLALFGPLALLIGRHAARRGGNAWAWGLMFLWQPVIVGLVYLVVRCLPPRHSTSGAVQG